MNKVWKNVILVFLASFMGIMANPEMLMASDSVRAEDISTAKAVETVIEEPEVATPAAATTTVNRKSSTIATPVKKLPDNYIQITGRTIEIIPVSDTGVDAGNHVNKIGKLFYGHNSNAVFGALPGLGAGSTFTVVYGGETTTYRIAGTEIFEKNQANGRLQLDGKGNYMASIKNSARGHDLALMTCYGDPIEGKPGDATHRFVIYADEI